MERPCAFATVVVQPRKSGLGALSRNHDALRARGCFGGILLEIREVTGANVEVNDGGFLLQVDDWLAGLPLHGMSLRGIQFPRDGLKGVLPNSLSISVTQPRRPKRRSGRVRGVSGKPIRPTGDQLLPEEVED